MDYLMDISVADIDMCLDGPMPVPTDDLSSITSIYTNFPRLRNQFVTKLAEWKLTLNYKQENYTSGQTLINNLISLSAHLCKSFLKVEVLYLPTTPICFCYRANDMHAVLIKLIHLLRSDPNLVVTAPDFLAGALGMILVQVGRLSITDVSDENARRMDQLADVIDAQVGIGAYASIDYWNTREQQILKGVWERMHYSDPSCRCTQCKVKNLDLLQLSLDSCHWQL
ncbi:uncharacterized protein N7483_007532 [Penicillium malachiteum]|uniref:uncharacterized protein n=1 Tax=Penicillium malachiteum TaxID=1324776 RepID=UPI002548A618|nr:uncharacterized protein N7483_007532 [Penicillium malachiteum]KAJ5726175.1 hypothetical protein N7483_007532 [Penicillium malachiteum]